MKTFCDDNLVTQNCLPNHFVGHEKLKGWTAMDHQKNNQGVEYILVVDRKKIKG